MFLEFLQAITGVFVVVYDGQHGLKFTLGRAREVVGPGVRFKLPIIQKYVVEDTRHTTLDLEPQVIQLRDDLVYEVDCKVMYQIVDLRKAMIEIDDLVTGLQNRVVIAVQRIVQGQDRSSVRDTDAMAEAIHEELRIVEEQWGVRILKFGFSNISPSPASLEITQLELLASERLDLYHRLRRDSLSPESAVALVTGAVIATSGGLDERGIAERRKEESAFLEELDGAARQAAKEAKEGRRARGETDASEEGGDEEEKEDDEA